MKYYIKNIAFFAFFLILSQDVKAQSQCFPNFPVTGTYATGGSSVNKERVFWLTWGSTYAESIGNFPYGKPGTVLAVGSKSYGSISLGGERYMCVVAEIMTLSGGPIKSYIPGTYNLDADRGDFLNGLYNIGGGGGTNGSPQNKIASGIMNSTLGNTISMTMKISATTDGVPVRLRGVVFADAEALSPLENISATGIGNWSLAEVKKTTATSLPYEIRKTVNGTSETLTFVKGNNFKAGAVGFLNFKSTAYASLNDGYAVTVSSTFKGEGSTAIAFGLLTSGYDFGDAPESYGKAIHLIDDINLGNDEIAVGGSTVNVNATGYIPGTITYSVKRYLGSTPPDADINNMFSLNAKGDENSGNGGVNEEDAWPAKYRQFGDKEFYKPGDIILATIPYKKALANDIIAGWIDFNLNGTFDANERISATIPTDGDGNVTLEWTVPQTRVAYSTYVRLRYFGRNTEATSPTGNALNGEVEDHRIYILTPASSNPTINSKPKL